MKAVDSKDQLKNPIGEGVFAAVNVPYLNATDSLAEVPIAKNSDKMYASGKKLVETPAFGSNTSKDRGFFKDSSMYTEDSTGY